MGNWILSSLEIEKLYKNRIIFAGDSAHTFPPAGGFGLNTGVTDIYNLMNKIKYGLNEEILEDYNKE